MSELDDYRLRYNWYAFYVAICGKKELTSDDALRLMGVKIRKAGESCKNQQARR